MGISKTSRPRSVTIARLGALVAVCVLLNFVSDRLFTQDAINTLRRQHVLQDLAGASSRPVRRNARAKLAQLKAASLRRADSSGAAASGSASDFDTVEGIPVEKSSQERPPSDDEESPQLSAFELQLEYYRDPLTGREVLQFGYEVFGRVTARETTERSAAPILDAPVGGDYVLGAGDALMVSLWGSENVDQDLVAEIDRSGQIRLPVVGPVSLKGVTLGRSEALLRDRFDRFYQNYELRVSLTEVRDMPVHVTGHVTQPGRIRVPSVATLFDALREANGVTKEGSLRRVIVRRTGEEDRSFDLFAYLLAGDRSVDIHLEANDVVVVPSVGARAAIVGRVLRPAIYEIAGSEVGYDGLLSMAGNYARLADTTQIEIESTSNEGLSIERVLLDGVDPKSIKIHGGDVVIVRNVAAKLDNVVYLRGNVTRPGRYALASGMRVSDIVTADALVDAGFWLKRLALTPSRSDSSEERDASEAEAEAEDEQPITNAENETPEEREEIAERIEARERARDLVPDLPEPFLEYALISRIDPRTKQESKKAFHLGKAVIDRDPSEDHVLQPQDTIIVFPRDAFQARKSVSINGAIENPDDYEFHDGMRVLDLIRMSGGLRPEAQLHEALLTRVLAKQGGTEYESVIVDVNAILGGDQQANFELQHDDTLTIRQVKDFKLAYLATITGEVRHPGEYSIIPGERVSALIERAGGFTENAYLPAAQFFRKSVREFQQQRLEEVLARLETELSLSSQRFVAEASVVNEEQVEFAAEQARIERVLATIRRTSAKGRMVIRLDESEILSGTESDVELMDNDALDIPRRPEVVHVLGAVFSENSLLHRSGLVAKDYLQECGGATESADLANAYIIRADGSADSAKFARKNYRWNSKRLRYDRGNLLSSELDPGDTLVIPPDVTPKLSRWGLTKNVSQILFQAALATGVVVTLF